MKKLFGLFIFHFIFTNIYSQTAGSNQRQNDSIYITVDSTPKFDSGDMYKWIGEHISYPQSAFERRIEGKVFVSFVIEKDGSVSGVTLLQGVDSSLNREALRVVSLMPAWKPGRAKGMDVRTKVMLPISFKIKMQTVDKDEYKVYCDTCVEKRPEYSGDLRGYLRSAMHYSQVARRNHAQGKIVVSFIIEKDGTITDIEISKCEAGAELLQENALQVVDNWKTIDHRAYWSPGYLNGKPVRVKKHVTLNYRLRQ